MPAYIPVVKAGHATRRFRAVKCDAAGGFGVPVGRARRADAGQRYRGAACQACGAEPEIWFRKLPLSADFIRNLAQPLRGDVKDAQVLMRHSRASTTLDHYQQFVPESQRSVVDRHVN